MLTKTILLLTMAAATVVNGATNSQDLIRAAIDGDATKVQELLQNGADVEAKQIGHQGGTALYYASRNRHTGVVKMLLGAGAEVDAEANGKYTALIVASNYNDTDLIGTLIEAGADVTKQTSSGATALHHASYQGHADVVELLLKAGADVNADEYYGTPLHRAAWKGHVDVVELLLEAGADVDTENSYGRTALAYVKNSESQRPLPEKHDDVIRLLSASPEPTPGPTTNPSPGPTTNPTPPPTSPPTPGPTTSPTLGPVNVAAAAYDVALQNVSAAISAEDGCYNSTGAAKDAIKMLKSKFAAYKLEVRKRSGTALFSSGPEYKKKQQTFAEAKRALRMLKRKARLSGKNCGLAGAE